MPNLRQDVHDRLWRAFQRWEELRKTGLSKYDLKMRGIREAGDPSRFTGAILFTGCTLRSYEGVLKEFVEFAQTQHPVSCLEDIGKKDFRAFMDRAIAEGLAVKTLNRYRSALVKLGCLTGQAQSFIALGQKYGWRIRSLARAGQLPTPARATPNREVLERAIAILKAWDARHFARTDEYRAYHLAARLQLETAARSVSATERVAAESLREGNQIELVGKGGKVQTFTLSADLHRALARYLARTPGPLAQRRGYQSAYARAVVAAGGRVTGTHGVRRLAARNKYAAEYRAAVGSGMDPRAAAAKAAGDAVEALGHSRYRRDHRLWYLNR
ncbi:MAG TPA: site-specific integrase [Planctomycetota bacterium]|nr:site-specific integrase [Planctomycetota bacterium]